MKVRFLKNHPPYQQGDVVDLPVSAASKLLWRRLAENYDGPADPEPDQIVAEICESFIEAHSVESAAEPAPVETAALEPLEETAVTRTFLPRRRRIKVDE